MALSVGRISSGCRQSNVHVVKVNSGNFVFPTPEEHSVDPFVGLNSVKQSLDDVQKLQRHDKYGDNKDDLNQSFSLSYRELCRPPSAKGITGRKNQSELQVYIMREKEDEQGGDGINEDNEYLVHIYMDEVQFHQMVERGHKQKSNAGLDESSIESNGKHRRVDEPAPGLLLFDLLFPLIRPWKKNGDDNPNQDIGQDLLEEFIADPCGDDGPCYGPRQGESSQLKAHLKSMILFLPKGYDSGDILYEQCDTVGPVGEGAIQPQKDEGGQGDSRTATGHDIHETGNGPDSKEKQYLQ